MTHEFIFNVLSKIDGEDPVELENCVLSIGKHRDLIFMLSGDTDYDVRDFEVLYANNHEIKLKTTVRNKEDLIKYILKSLH